MFPSDRQTEAELGVKIEIKNMNSISGVRRALAYEIPTADRYSGKRRQARAGNSRLERYLGETFLMRTKEFAHDYRYFPDPDLVPVKTDVLLNDVRPRVPELPKAKRARFVEQYQVSPYDAGVLANDLDLAKYFETAAKGAKKPKNVANWILNDLQSALSNAGKTITGCPIAPKRSTSWPILSTPGKSPVNRQRKFSRKCSPPAKARRRSWEEKGIAQLSDASAIEALCDQVIAANPKPAADFKAGNVASLNFLKGQVMKLSGGRANPQLAGEILERKLKS
jgi:aspartyl-tRNA(Asn)/glutamyl-tRNA(Gln) amidotransferase subunit B